MSESLTFWPTLTVFVGLTAWLLTTRFRQGRLVSPFSVSMLMLVAIFGARPLLMLSTSTYDFYGFDVVSGFEDAAIIGFVAVVCLAAGNLFGAIMGRQRAGVARTNPNRLNQPSEFEKPQPRLLPAVSAIAAVSVLGIWIIAMIVLGGGVAYIAVLFAGRSQAAGETLLNVPALVPALPVIAALVVALTRFRFERFIPYTARQSAVYWIVVALCIIPPSALGTRRFLIPSIVAALLGACGPGWTRTLRLRWLIGAAAAFIALAIFPFVRSAGSRTGDTSLVGAMGEYFSSEGIQGVLNSFFLSYDTEMFNYVAYLAPRLGDSLPYGFGRGTLGEALLAPIPANILPFQTWSNELLLQAFGGTCAQAVCPVPSVVGTLYYDLAFPGVVIGMLVLGLLCAGFESRLWASQGKMTGLLLLLAGFATVIVRGNPISQLWIAAQCWIVLLIVDWAVRRLAAAGSSPPVTQGVRTPHASAVRLDVGTKVE
ncbi:oligosaccharide repeat unit polymerase [Cryobacterium lactosi]|uniref:Oligosaccharide repeat unit polymerase n=1 Tax=Cryobacterium lactosi TaxID=1259202 RepID=A0A4R9BGA6_9MICO|nr:O-antigen polymerase [Cryobacterium lactosi]TFD83906.1 oligosaccharide repeat unit polymerase [Cryobacterium lactosi]